MKVKCIDNKRYKDLYTIGKVYDFEPEKGMINDLGGNAFRRFKTFEMLNEASGAEWELVEDEIEEETAEPSTYLLKCTATSSVCCAFTIGKEYIYTAGKGIVDDGGTTLLNGNYSAVEDITTALWSVSGAEFELVSEVPSISRDYAKLGKMLAENTAAAIEAVESEEPAVDYLEKYREALEERDMYKNDLEDLKEAYKLLGKKADAAIVKHANRKNKLEKKCKTLYIKLHGVEKSYKNAVDENTKLHEQVKELEEVLREREEGIWKVIRRMNQYADDMELIKTFVNRIADREE